MLSYQVKVSTGTVFSVGHDVHMPHLISNMIGGSAKRNSKCILKQSLAPEKIAHSNVFCVNVYLLCQCDISTSCYLYLIYVYISIYMHAWTYICICIHVCHHGHLSTHVYHLGTKQFIWHEFIFDVWMLPTVAICRTFMTLAFAGRISSSYATRGRNQLNNPACHWCDTSTIDMKNC